MTTIPATVPKAQYTKYQENYTALTKNTDKLFLFAGDQKIEHLNKDFYGNSIPTATNNPEYLFKLAATGYPGAFATQLGLVSRYGKKYQDVNYIIKLNSKTDIIPKEHKDPLATTLWCVNDVVQFQHNSQLNIRGVGYTLYIGSEYEHIMLHEAAQTVYQAHANGLIAMIWIYPRGKYVPQERDAKIIAGAAGVAACLGADFVKLNGPQETAVQPSAELLAIATETAGNTKIICSGGKLIDKKIVIDTLTAQLHIGKTAGCAIGRNIYQRPFDEAVELMQTIAQLVYTR
jgi:DhnA family fructose-bisphosphate aldolase class Ia